MKLIPLTQGKFAKVDDEDFEFLSQWKWHVHRKNKSSTYYAVRATYTYLNPDLRTALTRKQVKVCMHNEIMNPGNGQQVDHRFGNGLDNRKSKLRFCTPLQNNYNTRKTNKKTSSSYKGVCFNKKENKWYAQIRINYHLIFLGLFKNEWDAALTYNKAAKKHFGKFANLNKKLK